MADLTEEQSSQSMKISGSDLTGIETNYVDATALGELKTSDIITGSGAEAALTIGTSAIEAKCGVTALANRKVITIYNNSSHVIYWGRTSGVTASTGTPIATSSLMVFEFSADAPVYLVSAFSGNNVRITESI